MQKAVRSDCVDAINAAREGYLPSDLFEKCAVGPAITSGDLAGLTSEEFGELWELVCREAAAWADRLLKIHSWEKLRWRSKSKSAAGAAVLTKLAKQRPPGGEFTGGREERAEATTMALKAAQEPRLGF